MHFPVVFFALLFGIASAGQIQIIAQITCNQRPPNQPLLIEFWDADTTGDDQLGNNSTDSLGMASIIGDETDGFWDNSLEPYIVVPKFECDGQTTKCSKFSKIHWQMWNGDWRYVEIKPDFPSACAQADD